MLVVYLKLVISLSQVKCHTNSPNVLLYSSLTFEFLLLPSTLTYILTCTNNTNIYVVLTMIMPWMMLLWRFDAKETDCRSMIVGLSLWTHFQDMFLLSSCFHAVGYFEVSVTQNHLFSLLLSPFSLSVFQRDLCDYGGRMFLWLIGVGVNNWWI